MTAGNIIVLMEQIEFSETSAIINQTPGNHPKEDILYCFDFTDFTGRR
jgi:hypothetical protein